MGEGEIVLPAASFIVTATAVVELLQSYVTTIDVGPGVYVGPDRKAGKGIGAKLPSILVPGYLVWSLYVKVVPPKVYLAANKYPRVATSVLLAAIAEYVNVLPDDDDGIT